MNSVAELMAVGTSLFAAWRAERLHRNSLHADGDLHMRALAQQTEQHFQQLTAELLSAAKETDRDVWEQRNGQFQTLILAATLMFGVAMSAIIEGNFDAGAASPPARIAFATFVALALSSLFLCLIACVLVSRRMSYYMIGRAVSFVDRLGHILWTANHMIATTAEVAPLPATHPYVAEASAARAAARASSVDRLRTRRFSPPSSSLPGSLSSASLAAAAPAAAAFAAAGARARARSLIGAGAADDGNWFDAMRKDKADFQREMMGALEVTTVGKRAAELQRSASLARQASGSSLHLSSVPAQLLASPASRGRSRFGAEPPGDDDPAAAAAAAAAAWGTPPPPRSSAASYAVPPAPAPSAAQPRARTPPAPPPPLLDVPPRGSSDAASGICGGVGGGSSGGGGGVGRRPTPPSGREPRQPGSPGPGSPVYRMPRENLSFDQFWVRYCAWLGRLAEVAFFFGTASVWVAVIVFQVVAMQDYENLDTPIFVSICTTALLIALVLFVMTIREDKKLTVDAQERGAYAAAAVRYAPGRRVQL